MIKTGVLLINLGTPDDCSPKAVYRYLTEFLNDPRVIDIPHLARWLLVNLAIVPLRYRKSAQAYQQIWLDSGSPLLVYSTQLKEALATHLGTGYQVELGMRYGNPSIAAALDKLRDCQRIVVLPLFPQYSAAATGSAIAKCLEGFAQRWNFPEIQVINEFYNHPGFINAYAQLIQQHLAGKTIDQVIFSYHGLPERHITKSACQANCDHVAACPAVQAKNLFCYRAQCYETSTLLTKQLGLQAHQYRVAFQSRLGRTPWIKPYSDLVLPELIAQGAKNIAVVCPSFVADCLETLEEIDMRLREQWQKLGGGEFTFIPCLNADANWVQALAQLILVRST